MTRDPAQMPVIAETAQLHTRCAKYLIGMMVNQQALLDASALCEQAHFRDRSEIIPTTAKRKMANFVASVPEI